MKVLIPTTEQEPSLSTTPNRILGTAKSYLIYDIQDNTFSTIENTFFDTKDVNIAFDFKDLGIDNVITAKICQVCYENLRTAGIQVWQDDDSITIREAYQKFIMGGLFVTEKGHFNMHKKKVEEKIITQVVYN